MRRMHLIFLLSFVIAPAAVAELRVCDSDCDCEPGWFCRGEYPARCEPGVCTKEFAPVCGQDGRTYGNACLASLERIGIAYEGPCGRCGGAAGRKCAPCDFCDLDPGTCKGAKAEGTCRTVPTVCDQEGPIVCGCDGRNYANDCIRQMARVALAYEGPCIVPKPPTTPQATPRPQGSQSGTPRPTKPRQKQSAAAPPPEPPCPPVPRVVPLPPEPPPAAPAPPAPTPTAPVIPSAPTVPSDFAIPESDLDSDTCSSNDDCPASEFCSRPERQCSKRGTCKPRIKEACPEESTRAVCGCDGITYTDVCWANAAGQSVKCKGSCEECELEETP